MDGSVAAVARSGVHSFAKTVSPSVRLVTGLGVEGDAHSGTTVKHRSRVARDPSQPNLRQVHLIHAELHDELHDAGFAVSPGLMGENVHAAVDASKPPLQVPCKSDCAHASLRRPPRVPARGARTVL